MDFRSLIQSLDAINEDSKVHKGTYGNSYGKEDVRDQYGHKVGKVNKGAEDKKEAPKKGRGRPKKGADDSGEVKKYDTATLGSVFGGGKKPSKEVGKKSVKHSLKEYIEEAELALNEDASLGVKPLPGASEITMNNQPTGITAKDQQSATKIKDLMATGDISLPGAGDADQGVNNSLGEDEFDDEEHGSHDPAEYGMEGDYVKNQLHTIARVTSHLEEKLSDSEDLPEWVQEKVSQAKGMMVGVMDYIASEKERDMERETGEEGVISEKAKSKAQQRFFGMVHAMQKGKKVPGASKELKGVAKDIGKKDAKDFAKTKHKGLPDHVGEDASQNTPPAQQSPIPISKEFKQLFRMNHGGAKRPMEEDEVSMSNPGKLSNQEYKDSMNQRYGKPDLDTSRMNKSHQDFYDKNPSFKQSGKEIVTPGDGRLASKVVPAVTDTKVGRIPMNTPGGSAGRGGGMGGGTGLGGRRPGDDNRLNPLKLENSDEYAQYDIPRVEIRGFGPDFEDLPAGKKLINPMQPRRHNELSPPTRGDSSPHPSVTNVDLTVDEENVSEDKKRMSRAAKGHEKYGKEGMEALAKAGREGASEKKLDTIRNKYDKYDNKKKVKESTTMKATQLTEGAMKDLLINFYSDVESHKGDGSVFDLKKARNVQQAEEILKALVKHGDEYDGLDNSSQNELVNQTLKYLAHEKELPFNTFANADKERFATRTPNDLSSYRQNPGAKPGSDFSKPGSPMAVPRTPATGSNGFLKTLSTPQTFNESNDMKDKQFESWERELNSLLVEGITVSHSTGQQGSPDSLSINATEHDAGELMSILRNSGMGMFGGSKEQNSGYGAPMQGDEGDEEEFHQGIKIAPSPDVVGDGDDMLALIKKMSGIASDPGTPGSVEGDYEDEEGNEEVDEQYLSEPIVAKPSPDDTHPPSTPAPPPATPGSDGQVSELRAEYPGGSTELPEDDDGVTPTRPQTVTMKWRDSDEEPESGMGGLRKMNPEPTITYDPPEQDDDEVDEGNAFTDKLRKTPKGGEFKMGDKSYKDTSSIEEGDMEEGNAFTGKLAQTPKGGEFKMGDKSYKDTSSIEEGQENCNECGYPMESCGCDHVEEGYSNDAGGDAMGDTELLQLKELLSMGNDLHREKRTQSTGNIQKVTMETKLLKDATELLTDWKKLSGIK